MSDSSKYLSHVSPSGEARMVDVSGKKATSRIARAEAWVELEESVAEKIRQTGGVDKGPVLETARLAGIMAAKKTAELIPLCHPLPLDHVDVEAQWQDNRLRWIGSASCRAGTGVEMEALTAVSVAALTVYDMVKSAGKQTKIGPIRLLEKRGGKSG